MRARPAAAAVIAVTGLLLLSGCSAVGQLFGGDQAVRDAQTGEVTDGGQSDVFTLAVGDCMNEDSAEQLSEVPLVPCEEPHDDEVFHDFAVGDQGDAWPGDDTMSEQADKGCYDAFSDFVGAAYDDSSLDFGWFVPTEGSWSNGDRIVSCYVYDPAGKVTGSLEGSAR